MKSTIKFLDGSTQEANIIPGDTVAFERKYETSVAKLGEDPRMEHVLFLAYTALRRVGKTSQDFEEFLNSVEDIDSEEVPLAQPAP